MAPNELDGNQIDLKFSKDYRSSGDQAPNTLLGLASNVDATRDSKGQADQASTLSNFSSSSSSATLSDYKTQGYRQLASYLIATLLVSIPMQIYFCTDHVLVRQVAAI